MDEKLEDLNLSPETVRKLKFLGFEAESEFSEMSPVDTLTLPGIGGFRWRDVLRALGKDYPRLHREGDDQSRDQRVMPITEPGGLI